MEPTGAHGLTTAEARERLERSGANEIPDPPSHPVRRFLAKLWNLSAWMLELVVLLSAYLGKWADVAVAGGLLVTNAILGFAQESRASSALDELRGRLRITSRVLRDGRWCEVAARELVVDDVIRVRGGDFVPADARIVSGTVRVDQSALTGESNEVERGADDPLHSGSVVRRGEATALVTATGARTFYGRTTVLVQTARPKLHVEEVVSRVVRWLRWSARW